LNWQGKILMKRQLGFTLLEMVVVVAIIAIIAAIATPSYQEYTRRQRLALAKQEMQILAGELERFKGKNFSYKGFNPTHVYSGFNVADGKLTVPVNRSQDVRYTITLVDADTHKPFSDSSATGLGWVMIAERTPADDRNYDVLMTSSGLRCQTKTYNQVENWTNCGSESEPW
jgi:hypothetical protein